jgi:hypothetical protein
MTSEEGETPMVRPYVVTSRAKQGAAGSLPVETIVATSVHARTDHLKYERRFIADRCRSRPTSIVELATALDLALGVARLLVADLVAQGVLHHQETRDDEVEIIERLIKGISKL